MQAYILGTTSMHRTVHPDSKNGSQPALWKGNPFTTYGFIRVLGEKSQDNVRAYHEGGKGLGFRPTLRGYEGNSSSSL